MAWSRGSVLLQHVQLLDSVASPPKPAASASSITESKVYPQARHSSKPKAKYTLDDDELARSRRRSL